MKTKLKSVARTEQTVWQAASSIDGPAQALRAGPGWRPHPCVRCGRVVQWEPIYCVDCRAEGKR